MFEKLLVAAVIAETLTNIAKAVYDPEKRTVDIDLIVAVVFGIIIALVTQVDMLSALGLSVVHPIVGQVITGIVFARGASAVHDLLKSLAPQQ